MAEDSTTALIERQEWTEPLADEVQQAVSGVFEQSGEAGRKIKNFLHGTWLGHPLHPMLTDIPLGSWNAALVIYALEDLTGRDEFAQGADAAVTIGLAGAVAAAVTGLTDWQSTDGRARKIGAMHRLLNTTGALLYTGSLIARKKHSRSVGRGLSMLGFAVAGAGGIPRREARLFGTDRRESHGRSTTPERVPTRDARFRLG